MAPDLPAAVAGYERSADDGGVRWVWPSGAELYPALLRAGVRVARCHDVALAERLLLGREGRADEPATLAAAHARLRGAPVPAEHAAPGAQGARPGERPAGAAARRSRARCSRPAGTETTDARARCSTR